MIARKSPCIPHSTCRTNISSSKNAVRVKVLCRLCQMYDQALQQREWQQVWLLAGMISTNQGIHIPQSIKEGIPVCGRHGSEPTPCHCFSCFSLCLPEPFETLFGRRPGFRRPTDLLIGTPGTKLPGRLRPALLKHFEEEIRSGAQVAPYSAVSYPSGLQAPTVVVWWVFVVFVVGVRRVFRAGLVQPQVFNTPRSL